jgi:hypothetical protein
LMLSALAPGWSPWDLTQTSQWSREIISGTHTMKSSLTTKTWALNSAKTQKLSEKKPSMVKQ